MSFWGFDDMFDLNHDGRIDLGEEFLAYKMFEEVTREDEAFDEDEEFPEDEDDDF